MELRTFLRALRRMWWVILLITLVGGGAGYAVAQTQAPVYASTVTFFATTPTTAPGGSPYSGDQFAQRRVNTYVDLLSSDRLARLLVTKGGIQADPIVLARSISGVSRPETVLLTATVTGDSSARSLAVAEAVAVQFPALVRSIESDNGSKAPLVGLEVVDGPSATSAPISPRPKLLAALGLVVGLVLGVLLALLREIFDTSIRSAAALREDVGVPVLAVIANDGSAKQSPLVDESGRQSRRAEAYRQLRTNLQFVDAESPVQSIVVTSALPGEGKSTTSANLAIVFAATGKRVLLVEADMRRPQLAEYLGLESAAGLTNVLVGDVSLDDVLQPWGDSQLQVLSSGTLPPNPSELLGGPKMAELVLELRRKFDIVIFDVPPVLPVADATVLSAHADGVIVVVRYGNTSRQQVSTTLDSLRAVDARVLGAVLNAVPVRRFDGAEHALYEQYESRPAVDDGASPADDEAAHRSGVRALLTRRSSTK